MNTQITIFATKIIKMVSQLKLSFRRDYSPVSIFTRNDCWNNCAMSEGRLQKSDANANYHFSRGQKTFFLKVVRPQSDKNHNF